MTVRLFIDPAVKYISNAPYSARGVVRCLGSSPYGRWTGRSAYIDMLIEKDSIGFRRQPAKQISCDAESRCGQPPLPAAQHRHQAFGDEGESNDPEQQVHTFSVRTVKVAANSRCWSEVCCLDEEQSTDDRNRCGHKT